MNEKPLFVVRVAGAGGYFENGFTASAHNTREDAEKAREKLLADSASRKHGAWIAPKTRVEDWTPTPAQVEAFREAQEWN